jgi:hypothetical protein
MWTSFWRNTTFWRSSCLFFVCRQHIMRASSCVLLLQEWRRGKVVLVVLLSATAILLVMLQLSELALLTKSARELTNDAPFSQQQQVNNAMKNHKEGKMRKQTPHHAYRNNTKPAAPSLKNDAIFNEGSVGNDCWVEMYDDLFILVRESS